MNSNKIKLNKVLAWEKPTTDKAWAEDVKQESLDAKFDKQLTQMRVILKEKLPKVEVDLKWITKYPDYKRKELDEEITRGIKEETFDLEGKTKTQFIENELVSQTDYYKWKVEKIKQSVLRIEKEQDLRKRKAVSRKPIGTTYYIDADNGNDANDGLSTGAAWATLDKFTEATRSAGDIAILRRGTTARYDNGSDLLFTSDGVVENPIVIEADYGNAFSDDVSLANTYTPTFGSKTITASATESELVAGDWIVLGSDVKKDWAYEVKSVSGVTVTLYLPYKGDESGAGIAGVKMLSASIWNIVAGDFQWNMDGDNYWKIQGIHIRGTDSNGNIELDETGGTIFRDCIIEGNGNGDTAIRVTDDSVGILQLLKSRLFNHTSGVSSTKGVSSWVGLFIKDSLIDNNGVASSGGLAGATWDGAIVEDSEFKNNPGGDFRLIGSNNRPATSNLIQARNVILSSSIEILLAGGLQFGRVFLEDHDGTIGDNRYHTLFGIDQSTPLYQSDTGTTRSGGSNVSIKVTPSTNLSTNWEMSRVKLFEIPIFATTASKTYKIFFNLPAAGFDSVPTAAELWIELEAWGHATNNHRKITKSTGTITADGTWRSLTITVAPAQEGVAYLRCYYAKTKEGAKDNIFFTDPLPVIA